MPRRPTLVKSVVDSLDALQKKLQLADHLGTDTEQAVRYIHDLVAHCRSPTYIERKKKLVQSTQHYRKKERA